VTAERSCSLLLIREKESSSWEIQFRACHVASRKLITNWGKMGNPYVLEIRKFPPEISLSARWSEICEWGMMVWGFRQVTCVMNKASQLLRTRINNKTVMLMLSTLLPQGYVRMFSIKDKGGVQNPLESPSLHPRLWHSFSASPLLG